MLRIFSTLSLALNLVVSRIKEFEKKSSLTLKLEMRLKLQPIIHAKGSKNNKQGKFSNA